MSILRRSAGPVRQMDRLTAEESLIQEASGVPLFRRGDTVRLVWDAKDCISVG